ncbi:MAG TPA: hypothetical protein PKM65_03320 [Spirochaetota bacterium]|nr:hypothetical protein [Spirochaetota bacterium]HNT10886.1 hypothetical protein [Spirochaetota bacterium]
MKTKFIKIRAISEIDSSKITVYDLNNRYIDPEGRMYGLRYNRRDRKIEIIRIIRTPANSAGFYQQKVVESKRSGKSSRPESESTPASPDTISDIFERADAPIDEAAIGDADGADAAVSYVLDGFDPDDVVNKALELLKTHKGRLHGMMINISNTQISSKVSREIGTAIETALRNLDLDGIQKIDKVMGLNKELVSFPRSVQYYIARLDTQTKDIVEAFGSQDEQMRFIFLYEMYWALVSMYKSLAAIVNQTLESLAEVNETEVKDLTTPDRQHIKDSRISLENTSVEVANMLKKLEMLRMHIYKAERL